MGFHSNLAFSEKQEESIKKILNDDKFVAEILAAAVQYKAIADDEIDKFPSREQAEKALSSIAMAAGNLIDALAAIDRDGRMQAAFMSGASDGAFIWNLRKDLARLQIKSEVAKHELPNFKEKTALRLILAGSIEQILLKYAPFDDDNKKHGRKRSGRLSVSVGSPWDICLKAALAVCGENVWDTLNVIRKLQKIRKSI